MTTYCAFEHGDRRIGFEMRVVREVVERIATTPLPRTPAFVIGLGNLRGEVLPLYDLRKFIAAGAAEAGTGSAARVIIIERENLRFAVRGCELQTLQADPETFELHPESATHPALETTIFSARGVLHLVNLDRLSASLHQALSTDHLRAA